MKMYELSGIQNIDDKYFGINILRDGNSVGYLEYDNYERATITYNALSDFLKKVNSLQKIYRLNININIEEREK